MVCKWFYHILEYSLSDINLGVILPDHMVDSQAHSSGQSWPNPLSLMEQKGLFQKLKLCLLPVSYLETGSLGNGLQDGGSTCHT
jgi:hypothetical protein